MLGPFLSCAPWLLVLIAPLLEGVREGEFKSKPLHQVFNPADFDGGQEITLVVSSYEGEPTESRMSPPTLHYKEFLKHVQAQVDESNQPHLVWSGWNLNGWERFKFGLLRRVWRPDATLYRDVQIDRGAINQVFEDANGNVNHARLHVLLIGKAWTGKGFSAYAPGFIFWARYSDHLSKPVVHVGNEFRTAPLKLLEQEVHMIDGLSFDYTLEVHTGTGSGKHVQKDIIPHAIIVITWSGYGTKGFGTTVVEMARRGGNDWNLLYQGEASTTIIAARKQIFGMDQPCEKGASEIRMLDLPCPLTALTGNDGVPTGLAQVKGVLEELQGEGGPVSAVRHHFDYRRRTPLIPLNRSDILEGMLSWAEGDMQTVEGSYWSNNSCQVFFDNFFRHFMGAELPKSFYRSAPPVRNKFSAQARPAQSDEQSAVALFPDLVAMGGAEARMLGG